MRESGVQLNWRVAQADHHAGRGRLLISYAAAYEGEARSCQNEGRRKYLRGKARQLRKQAELRFERAAQLGQPVAA